MDPPVAYRYFLHSNPKRCPFVPPCTHSQVLNIADFLHSNPKMPLCAKAHMRRAAAFRALTQYERAVTDLKAAMEIEPGEKELKQLLAQV